MVFSSVRVTTTTVINGNHKHTQQKKWTIIISWRKIYLTKWNNPLTFKPNQNRFRYKCMVYAHSAQRVNKIKIECEKTNRRLQFDDFDSVHLEWVAQQTIFSLFSFASPQTKNFVLSVQVSNTVFFSLTVWQSCCYFTLSNKMHGHKIFKRTHQMLLLHGLKSIAKLNRCVNNIT